MNLKQRAFESRTRELQFSEPGPGLGATELSELAEEFMVLSCDCVLLYVLHSGVRGRVTSGKAELDEREGVIVYDRFGTLNEYISGDRLRSWTVIRGGTPVPGWSNIMPEDAARLADQ
jgi:hypothetical protein